MRRWAVHIVMLLAWVGHACAAEPIHGRISLIVQQAVPFAGSAGNRNLHVDLTCRTGSFDLDGWAYVDALPGVEHAVRVLQSKSDGEKVHLELAVEFSHQLPEATGGKGVLVLDLSRSGTQLEGTYQATITGLDEKQRLELWESVGGRKASMPTRGVNSGRTQSLTHLAKSGVMLGIGDHEPIIARGRIQDLPATLPAAERLRANERPVLLGNSAFDEARQRARAGEGQRILGSIRQSLEKGRHGNILEGQAVECDGFAAVGYALLARVETDAAASAKAQALAQKALTESTSWQLPRALAGAALAYDLASPQWAAEGRAEMRKLIVNHARRLTGLDQSVAVGKSPHAPGSLLANIEGPYDYRLATARAAVGMGLLAILQDVEGAERAEIERMLSVVRRTVERFLAAGIGDRGAGTGNNGYICAIETVFPFLQAWKQVVGEDLAQGTGAQWTALWGMTTRGLAFGQGPDFGGGLWLPMAAAAVEPRHRPALSWHWQQTRPAIVNPYQGIYALLNLPTEQPKPLTWPLVLHDKRMGALAARSGWDDSRDFVLIYELGSATPHNAPMRGNLSLWGLGREWIRRQPAPFGSFNWPKTNQCNVLQVIESEMTRRGAAQFDGGGLLERLWADRNGSASVSMSTHGFVEPGAVRDDTSESKSWRMVGIDYSKASGAAAMLVMVEGAVGLADRQQVWEIDLGDVPADGVKIDGLSFTVRPPGTKASMKGTFLYPTTVFIQYAAPAEGKSGRIRAFREKPGEKSLAKLMKSMDERLDAQIQAMLKDEDSNIDIRKFDLPLEEPNTALEERLQKQSQTIYLKLLKETSSIKMGGGDRRPRAKGNLVVVLTVQEGDAPAVKVLDTKHDALVRVGEQTVTYVENLIQFGGRR